MTAIIGNSKSYYQTIMTVTVTICRGKSYYHTIMTMTASIGRSEPYHTTMNSIGGAMVSVLAASMIDRLFDPRLGKTRDSTIGICYFSSKLTALMSKNTDWLAWNHNNVSELGDMSIHELLFQ